MEINSCCIENIYYCIWFEKDWYFIEEMCNNVLLPLHLSHLVWFEKSFVELLQDPIQAYFFKHEKDDLGACRIRKFRINSRMYVECVVWPASGG